MCRAFTKIDFCSELDWTNETVAGWLIMVMYQDLDNGTTNWLQNSGIYMTDICYHVLKREKIP